MKLTRILIAAGALLCGAASAQEVTLRTVSSFAEGIKDSQRFERMLKDISARGAGRVRINYLGGAPKVMNPFEVVKNLKDGVIDMANANGAFFTNVVPEGDALKLTQLTALELRQNGGWAYLNKLLNEKANAYLLGTHDEHITFNLYLSKPIDKADLRGLKIRVSPIYRAMVEALGGTAISSQPSEVYTLMERGTVDGYGWPTAGIFDWSLEKVTKYRIEPAFYSTGLFTLVNLDVWKKMSVEQRKVLEDVMAEYEASNHELKATADRERGRQDAAGVKAHELPPDEAKKWLAVAQDAGWAAVIKASPEHGPKLRELFTRK